MAKIKMTLEFDSTEDLDEIRAMLDGQKWKFAIWEIDQELRKTQKYDDNASEDVIDFCYTFREEIRRILSDSNLILD